MLSTLRFQPSRRLLQAFAFTEVTISQSTLSKFMPLLNASVHVCVCICKASEKQKANGSQQYWTARHGRLLAALCQRQRLFALPQTADSYLLQPSGPWSSPAKGVGGSPANSSSHTLNSRRTRKPLFPALLFVFLSLASPLPAVEMDPGPNSYPVPTLPYKEPSMGCCGDRSCILRHGEAEGSKEAKRSGRRVKRDSWPYPQLPGTSDPSSAWSPSPHRRTPQLQLLSCSSPDQSAQDVVIWLCHCTNTSAEDSFLPFNPHC